MPKLYELGWNFVANSSCEQKDTKVNYQLSAVKYTVKNWRLNADSYLRHLIFNRPPRQFSAVMEIGFAQHVGHMAFNGTLTNI